MRRSTKQQLFWLCMFGLITFIIYKFCECILLPEQTKLIRENLVKKELFKQACVHPELNIDDETLAKFFYKSEPITCDSEQDWICINNSYAFVCNSTLENHKEVECNLTFLKRQSDYAVLESERAYARNSDKIKLKSDFFRVSCKDKIGVQWSNVMAGIYDKKDELKRAGKEYLPKDSLGLNVLIWGHDSLSRMTFMRKLPKTYEYLTKVLGAIVLKGYNIVGDGTPQALIPILTGKTELELPETRKRKGAKADFVNVYPFVWKEFQYNGYVTAYAEDSPGIGTFTYRLKGFNEQPTDHYMRTFYLAAEKEYNHHKKNCLRSTPRHKVAMNWIRHFYSVYNDKPKFSFSFLSEISHDDYNLIGSADEDLRQTISSLQSDGYLNNTLLIIMSDHGHRFAKIRETQQGKQEERLPFFAFVFPPWFEQKYPIAMRNFRNNSERLTTPFDMYPTLYNILHFEGAGTGNLNERGISLFKDISPSRTCEHAGIEAHWCACLHWKPVDTLNSVVQTAAKTLLQYINDMTEFQRELCATLKLDDILYAIKYVPSKGLLQFKKNADMDGFVADMSDRTAISVEMYEIKIQTQPGYGHFEALLKYDVNKKLFTVKESDISRVNKYGKAAKCIENTQEQLRKYCYCKNTTKFSRNLQ